MLPTIFNFKGQELRLTSENNEPWFIAQDACTILGLGNPSLAVNGNSSREDAGLDNDEKGLYSVNTLGGNQKMLCVNESGLYSLVFKSRKPEAKSFKRWITHEVIPSIRKTGSYSAKPTLPLKKLLALVKTKREFFLLSGMSKPLAYSKALTSVEAESGVDLSEFKPISVTAGNHAQLDLTPILDAIKATISNRENVYRDFGGGAYALNRDKVYVELDARGLSRKNSLAALWGAGFLERGGVHFTKHFRINRGRTVRAVFVRVEDRETETGQGGYLN